MRKLACFLFGHDWQNDKMYPVHGWKDLPNPGSYCVRCKKQVPDD